MNWINVAIVVHVLVAMAIIGLVLLQHGKGADMGSGFGGGASGSLFGATGSANFLSRTTAILAAVFFASSLTLAYLATTRPREAGSVVDRAPAVQPKAPAQKLESQKGEAKNEKPQGAESSAPAPAEKSVPQ
ncbi:MAG TPA: preprotein translocase subunit SecG [Burkholderiales bacterium]|jgi:preprotein translocase subunit SecG